MTAASHPHPPNHPRTLAVTGPDFNKSRWPVDMRSYSKVRYDEISANQTTRIAAKTPRWRQTSGVWRRYDCHESPNNLEFFVWDEASCRVPPAGCCRAVPRWEVRWRAVANARACIAEDGK